MKNKKQLFTTVFLVAEAVLYGLILTAGGDVLVVSSFGAIVLCFVFALLGRGTPHIVTGLACTVGADFFLVVCDPIQQLYGMICFLAVQTLYAIFLHKQGFGRQWLVARVALMAVVVAVAVAVLREKMDGLAMVSVLYYVNLLMNAVQAFCRFGKLRWMAIGLVLFILCDTVVGLQVAAGGYLPIAEGSVLHKILFVDFNLAWCFYLPSQVLLALQAQKK